MKVYYDKDVKGNPLKRKIVAIMGFGSQAHAHANNLAESGIDVIIGVRQGKSLEKAKKEDYVVYSVDEAAACADVIMMLLPDESQADIYNNEIAPCLKRKEGEEPVYLGFAHGLNIHFDLIKPDDAINVFMVAPKAPGHTVFAEFEKGSGVPMLIAVHQDPTGDTKNLALAYAGGIGGGRAGIIETTFKDETETDLFGEQTVLCGGLTSLIKASFETLVEAGYPPEMAYFECMHEVKLITDLLHQGGISNMRYSISNTAQWGDITVGPTIVDSHVKDNMKKALAAIQDGSFVKKWMAECKAGKPEFNALTKKDEEHQIEKVGAELRAMMPWLKKGQLVDREKN